MKRILIMEGNAAFAGELSDCFSAHGYEVCGVTDDGAEGLKLLEQFSPNVAVMSLSLKNADGFTVMETAPLSLFKQPAM